MCIAFDAWRWWYSTDCQLSDDSKIDWKENEEQALYLFGMEQMQTNNDTYTHTQKKTTYREREKETLINITHIHTAHSNAAQIHNEDEFEFIAFANATK